MQILINQIIGSNNLLLYYINTLAQLIKCPN